MPDPDVIVVEVETNPVVVVVEVEGPPGGTGRGITVSETAPENPQLNDLWVDIS